jgi:hypothetical protein
MSESNDLRDALRRLLDATVAFERKTARHSRLDTERQALCDAITSAQLILSVGPHGAPPADAVKPEQQPLPMPMLQALKGGRRLPAGTRRTPIRRTKR